MKGNEVFRQSYSRLAKEGWIKAFIAGAIVGFAANFIAAFALWFAGKEQMWWLAICIGAAFIVLSAPVFYVCFFRPTARKIAERVDALGLEERLITMLELENDESYIAMRQREDAKAHLRKISDKQIKFIFSKAALISAAVVALVGVGMTTYSALSHEGLVPDADSVKDKVEDSIIPEEEVFYEVIYLTEGGGMIDGEDIQIVLKGEATQPVVAVADDGWMFEQWLEDGYTEEVRTDSNIQGNVTYTAVFVEVEYGDGGENGGEEEGEGEGPSDAPGDGDGNGNGQGQGNGNGNGESLNGSGNGQGQGAGGGASAENDQVHDGQTDYQDVLQAYLDLYNEYKNRGEEVPEEILKFLEQYYGTLA